MSEWMSPVAVHSKCGESSPHVATRSIDEDLDLYWNHYATCWHWIIVDLGATFVVTKVRIYQRSYPWGGGQWDDVEIYVGDNPADLGDAVWRGTFWTEGANQWNPSDAFEKSGRYVKLKCYDENDYMDRLYEIEVEIAPSGWGGKVLGVVAPAKVTRIDVADILSVLGVE